MVYPLDLWDLIVAVLHGTRIRMIKYGKTRKELKKMQVKKKSHSKIEADDEVGLAMQREGS